MNLSRRAIETQVRTLPCIEDYEITQIDGIVWILYNFVHSAEGIERLHKESKRASDYRRKQEKELSRLSKRFSESKKNCLLDKNVTIWEETLFTMRQSIADVDVFHTPGPPKVELITRETIEKLRDVLVKDDIKYYSEHREIIEELFGVVRPRSRRRIQQYIPRTTEPWEVVGWPTHYKSSTRAENDGI